VCGWAALTVAAAQLCTNLLASLRRSPAALSLPARLLAVAQACLVLALAVALASALEGSTTSPPLGSARAAIAVLAVPGWLGLTVCGSLLHLLAVLARVRDLRQSLPVPRPVRDRLLATIAVAGLVGLAVSGGHDVPWLEAAAVGALGVGLPGARGARARPRRARLARGTRDVEGHDAGAARAAGRP
jgi:hypothetical protein